MKTNVKKVIAILLAVIFCLNLVGCSNPPGWDGSWEIAEEDCEKMVFAETMSNEIDGTRYITLSADNASFKSDITSDMIRVVAYCISETAAETITADTNEEDIAKLFSNTVVENVSLENSSEKTIEISFKEPEYDYFCMYCLYVHKDAVESDCFVTGFQPVCIDESVTTWAEITTTGLKNGMRNPTLELKLMGTAANEEIKPEDITLSGVFEELEVTSVSGKDDIISLETKGTIEVTSVMWGYIELGAGTTESGISIIAKTEVENLDAYIDDKSFAFEDGLLSFDAEIYGASVELADEEMAALVTVGNERAEKVVICDDKTSLKIYLKSHETNIDEAVNALYGKTLKIDSKAVGGDGISVEIIAGCASLGGVIRSIEKPEGDSDKFTVAAQLYARNGDLSELSASDIKFIGDFEGAEVTSVKNSGNECDIEFTFSADKDKKLFNGYVEISEGKLTDHWGTVSENNSAGLAYAFETSRDSLKAIDNLVEKFTEYSSEDLINDIVNIAMIIQATTLSEFYGGDLVGAVFSLMGIDSGADAQVGEILSIVTDMKSMIGNLDCDIKDLKNTVEKYGDDIISLVQKNNLKQLEKDWNTFNTNYVEKLDKTVNSYIADCRRSLVDYIRAEHGSELVLYYDEEGKLAIPDKTNPSFSVDAKKIDESKTVKIPLDDNTFSSCTDVFARKGSFSYSDELSDALKADLGNAVRKMNENGDYSITYTAETGKTLYGYINKQIMFKHLDNSFLNDIKADYVNLCKQIYANNGILYTFDEMMKYKYNFQSEAAQDMKNIRKAFTAMIFNYGFTASFAEKYDKSGGREITDAYHKALDVIKNYSGLYEEPEGYSFCYVIDNFITMRISAVKYNMEIKYSYENFAGDKQTRDQWTYEGYEDNGPEAYVYYTKNYDRPTFLISGLSTDWMLPAGTYIGTVSASGIKGIVNLLSENILDAKDLKIIKTRFNNLKASNRFISYSNMTFGDYMTSGKLINPPSEYMVHMVESNAFDVDIKPTKILTSGVSDKDLTLDGSRALICNKDGLTNGFSKVVVDEKYRYGAGYYFTPGKEYRLIDKDSRDYDRKASKEYFHIHKEYDATVYDMKTDSMKSNYVILQAALYGERHRYWNCDEAAYFYNTNYQEPYFIFPIG